jgi:hypothetical protein
MDRLDSGGRPQRVWSLWKTGAMMDAEIGTRPTGFERQIYVRGDLLCSLVHRTRDQADQEARELKMEMRATGAAVGFDSRINGL